MKIEVGMYVRIKWGNGLQTISKCKNIVDMGDTQYAKEDFYIHTDHSGEVIYKTMIVKSSFNIIDLVDCGDYLNGFRVNKIERDKTNTIIKIGNSTFNVLENEEIYTPSNDNNNGYEKIEKLKSIVTKKQFSNMEYRIGE